MFRITALIAGACLALAAPASAEVVSRTADGFVLRCESRMETTPKDMIATVGELPLWWDKAHTYTGDNANLSLDLEPGGCWCETMADGDRFRHARVVSITENAVVFDAPLGPLNGKATKAQLTFPIGDADAGWLVSIDYAVEGRGLGVFADPVNEVMEQAYGRFVHHLRYGETVED